MHVLDRVGLTQVVEKSEHLFWHGLPTGLVCASLNQRGTPIEVRERLVDGRIDWAACIAECVPQSTAWYILSTCNRFELYLQGESVSPTVVDAILAKALQHTSDTDSFKTYFDYFSTESAAEHLCRVAAGLESKVLGEAQILGQLVRAYEQHLGQGRIGLELGAVLRAAIRAGKRARAETQIGANAASIGSVAIQTVEAHPLALAGSDVAVIGLGEMGQIVARSLANRGVRRLLLVNRTPDVARRLADELDGTAIAWEDKEKAIQAADVVFAVTAAPGPVITLDSLHPASGELHRESERLERDAKVIVDLAVPRNVAPAVAELQHVRVIDLDALQTHLDAGLAQRQSAVPAVERIIGDELDRLQAELRELVHRPLIVDLRQKAEAIRRHEVERSLRFLQDADPTMREQLEHLSHALVNKLLHDPTHWIRAAARAEEQDLPAELVRSLFGLAPGEAPQTSNPALNQSDLNQSDRDDGPENRGYENGEHRRSGHENNGAGHGA